MKRNMTSLCLNKKGNLLDIAIIPYLIMFLIIIVIIGGYILYAINDFAQTDPGSTDKQKSVMADYLNKYRTAFDMGILLYFFALVGVTIVSAYFIKSNPIFFTSAFIVWILSMITLPYIANTMINMMNTNPLTNFTTAMVGTRFLLKYFVLINILSGAGILYALYSKTNENNLQIGAGGNLGGNGGDAFE